VIARINNKYLRRLTIIIVTIPVAILNFVAGGVKETMLLPEAIANAW
jgi:hypothetical protein